MQMKLDSSGNLYPAITTSKYPQIFRITVMMVTAVDPDFLKQAVRETLPFFSAFHVMIKKKCFWYYLEDTDKMPEIKKLINGTIQPFQKTGLQFRFLYEKNCIHLEVFHALTDGVGAIHFLHAVCYRYCQIAYPKILQSEVLERRYGLNGMNQVQDAYQKVKNKKGNFWNLLKQRRAFQIQEPKKKDNRPTTFTAKMALPELKRVSKKYQATICELLTAVCLFGLWQEYKEKAVHSGRMFRICVPVNLRPFFQKETEKNFFTCISVEIDPGKMYTLESLMTEVKRQFQQKCTTEYLQERISEQIAGQRTIVSRYSPLSLKNWFLNRIYRFNGYSTMVLSNMGKICPNDEFIPYIAEYRCVLPLTEMEPVKAAVCSYKKKLVFTINSNLIENRLCLRLFEILRTIGITTLVEINETAKGKTIKEKTKPKTCLKELQRYELERTEITFLGNFT